MPDPIIHRAVSGAGAISPVRPGAGGGAAGRPGEDFASMLRSQLEQVSQIQQQADDGVKRILTGESDNLTEVFTAAKRAQIAFDLLMEIRNKLVDSYVEMRQLRV